MQSTINLNQLSIKHVQQLNRINNEIKKDYHKVLEAVFSKTDGSIFWIVNSIFCRYNYISSIFLDLCYLVLVKEIVRDEKVHKIVCKNNIQKKVIKNAIKNTYPTITVISNEGLILKIANLSNPFIDFLKNIRYSIKFILLKNKKRSVSKINNKKIILVDTFFIDSMFTNGKFEDRYYPGMIENIPKKIRSSIFFVPNVQIKNKLRKCLLISENVDENFIYKFDFLRPIDYLKALFAPFIIKKIKFNNIVFRDAEISALFQSDFYKNISHSSSFVGLLNYFFFKRLREKNCKIELAVNWFENQIIDRGFNKGLSTFFPNVKTVGYQGFISSYEYEFQLQPTELEKEIGIVPKSIAVVGKGLIKDIKKYCGKLNVTTAPGYRMSSVYSIKTLPQSLDVIQKNILVVLSISQKDNNDIINIITEFNQNYITEKINFIIKPHPSNDFNKVELSINNHLNNFVITKEPPNKLFHNIDIVIGNTSSLCIEALIYGKPVIIIGSQSGITQNPIPESISKEIWDLCYDVNEVEKAFQRLTRNKKKIAESDIPLKVRENFIEKTSKRNVKLFLHLN